MFHVAMVALSVRAASTVHRRHMYRETESCRKISNTVDATTLNPQRGCGQQKGKNRTRPYPPFHTFRLLLSNEQLTEFALYLYRITRSLLSIKLAI